MLQSNLPSTDTFTVTAAGSAVTVYTVQAALAPAPLNAFWILVRPTIQQGQVVVVTYTDPTAGDDANAIQNTAGNDAATFTTGMDGVPAVTNNSITNTPATGAPTITGTATVGQTLTAVTTGIMDADGLTSVSYTYQWIRVATDNTETNIASATASTYTLVAADQGTTIKVTVSFTDDASNDETLTSAATAAVAAAANTPATGAPTITGTAQVGQTLTAGTTAIMDANGLNSVNYMYQWIRVDGTDADISGATSITYTLVGADLGKTIKVTVSFTDDASNDETLTSAATAAVWAAPNTPATGAPTITGTAQVGQTLTAVTTAIMDADGLTSVSYTYQWIRVDGTDADISGATSITYTLVGADLGKTIKVTVSFTDDASNDETLTSAATAAVAAAPNTPATGAPTITGTAQVGQTLTAGTTAIMDADGLTSVSYTYQWIRVATTTLRRHRLGDGEHLHAGGGRPGHDDQGDGELHRRRQQRRDADQRGDGGRCCRRPQQPAGVLRRHRGPQRGREHGRGPERRRRPDRHRRRQRHADLHPRGRRRGLLRHRLRLGTDPDQGGRDLQPRSQVHLYRHRQGRRRQGRHRHRHGDDHRHGRGRAPGAAGGALGVGDGGIDHQPGRDLDRADEHRSRHRQLRPDLPGERLAGPLPAARRT